MKKAALFFISLLSVISFSLSLFSCSKDDDFTGTYFFERSITIEKDGTINTDRVGDSIWKDSIIEDQGAPYLTKYFFIVTIQENGKGCLEVMATDNLSFTWEQLSNNKLFITFNLAQNSAMGFNIHTGFIEYKDNTITLSFTVDGKSSEILLKK